MEHANEINIEDTVSKELLEIEQDAEGDEDSVYEKLLALRDRLEIEFHRVMVESPLDDRLSALDSSIEKIAELLAEMRS
jgi:hypothetical protein